MNANVWLCVVPFTKLHQTLIKDTKMEELKIFDANGKALHIADVISRFIKQKAEQYGVYENEVALYYEGTFEIAKVDTSDDYKYIDTLETMTPINGL